MKYKCTRCNKVLSSEGHAARHVRQLMHIPLVQLIECGLCGKTIVNGSPEYDDHIREFH
jgi:DNA-directed RNA polymerase subunit RPC12/RpoP